MKPVNNQHPPAWAVRFVEWFCPDHLSEQILGDLYENFEEKKTVKGYRFARRDFILSSLKFFKPSILLQNSRIKPNIMMLRNYTTIAFRRLRSEKLISAINILSLSIGLASCLVILLFITHELSYDRHVESADRVVRVTREWFDQSGESNLNLARIAAPISPLLADNFPEIEQAGRINEYTLAVKSGDQYIDEQFYFTEPSILSILDLELESGDPATALANPHAVILSKEAARKHFPDGNPLGEALIDADGTEFIVTGVLKEQPKTTHLPVNILASWSTLEEYFDESFFQNWGGNNFFTYLKLSEGSTRESLAGKLDEFMQNFNPDQARSESKLHLQDIRDIHLYSHLDAEAEANGNITTVYIIGSVGLVILILACFNFISLSTSKALDRSREVGVRKVFGARRNQLIHQFIGEAVLTTLISLVLAVCLAYLLLPQVNSLIGRQLSFTEGGPGSLAVILVGILLLTGFVAGIYPALVLSGFRPAAVLRGRGKFSTSTAFQKSIVVIQFAITVTLIIWVMAMHRQLDFVANENLGFDREQIVILPLSQSVRDNYHSLKTQLENAPDIKSVTISKFVPSSTLVDNAIVRMETNGEAREYTIANIPIGHDYFKTYDIPLLAGREFIEGSASDSSAGLIVNREFMETVGYQNPEDLIGKTLQWGPGDEDMTMNILGVVENFHYESLHNEVPPAVFILFSRYFSRVSVKMDSDDPVATAESIATLWQDHMGNEPVWFEFVDQNLQELYENEQTTMTLIFYFSLMAIVIACSGLLGMVVHHAEQRRKEIAVRKVLGASEVNVAWFIVKRFMVLVLISLAIGLPAGYLITSQWLNGFVLHISLGAGMFINASLLVILFTLTATLFHSVKAALTNPVTNLRSE